MWESWGLLVPWCGHLFLCICFTFFSLVYQIISSIMKFSSLFLLLRMNIKKKSGKHEGTSSLCLQCWEVVIRLGLQFHLLPMLGRGLCYETAEYILTALAEASFVLFRCFYSFYLVRVVSRSLGWRQICDPASSSSVWSYSPVSQCLVEPCFVLAF